LCVCDTFHDCYKCVADKRVQIGHLPLPPAPTVFPNFPVVRDEVLNRRVQLLPQCLGVGSGTTVRINPPSAARSAPSGHDLLHRPQVNSVIDKKMCLISLPRRSTTSKLGSGESIEARATTSVAFGSGISFRGAHFAKGRGRFGFVTAHLHR
jgi:hypothetical protein